jgi:tryptophanyl-tRNA synthetase
MQHLEICRDIAQRFNTLYGEVFTVPEAYFGKSGARIMSLQEPGSKMSKSDENPNACVYLLDDRDTIIRKFKKAVTDSLGAVKYDVENQSGVSNLLDIYSACTGKPVAAIETEFAGKGYGDFKLAVGETVADALKPLQARYAELGQERGYIDGIIKSNAEKAANTANKTLREAQRAVGFPETP